MEEGRGPVTQAHRLRIIRRFGEGTTPAMERRDVPIVEVVAEEVPKEEEVLATSGVPKAEVIT